MAESSPQGGGSAPSHRRRRHSVDGRGTSEKLLLRIKQEGRGLFLKYRELKPLADRHWHATGLSATSAAGDGKTSATNLPLPVANNNRISHISGNGNFFGDK